MKARHCLDARCEGKVEFIAGRMRCNVCGIVQDEKTMPDVEKTFTLLKIPKRSED